MINLSDRPRTDWKAKRYEMIRQSTCQVLSGPNSMIINFTGPCAKIPSLKNSKVKGFNHINSKTLCSLQAMTELFRLSARDLDLRYFEDRPVWISVALADSCSRCDSDNCLAAIRDWLEPPVSPNGKPRRYGVGILKNDRKAHGFALPWSLLGIGSDTTTILIMGWETQHESIARLWSNQFTFCGGFDGKHSA